MSRSNPKAVTNFPYACFQESILKTLQETVEAEEQKNSQKLQLYETQLNSVNWHFLNTYFLLILQFEAEFNSYCKSFTRDCPTV